VRLADDKDGRENAILRRARDSRTEAAHPRSGEFSRPSEQKRQKGGLNSQIDAAVEGSGEAYLRFTGPIVRLISARRFSPDPDTEGADRPKRRVGPRTNPRRWRTSKAAIKAANPA